MDLSGEWRAAPADDELRRDGIGIDADDSSWPLVHVPHHWSDEPSLAGVDGSVLYRRRFDLPMPTEGERTFVVLDGVFSQADVWLDGAYLGDPEGYFVPHSFEITGLARLSTDHVLAVEVDCSRSRDDDSKRTLTGALQAPPLTSADWRPGGLWRPVRIVTTGPVRIDRCRVLCRDANEARAHLRLVARLDADTTRTVRVRTLVDGVPLSQQERTLAQGSNDVAWDLDVLEPRLWWPWSLGDQPLTEVAVEVTVAGETSDRHVVRTGLREVALQDWVLSVNGERLFVKGALLGPTRRSLATASAEELRRDVSIAREMGLDLLRIRAHITRPELYDAADELGVLLWQDLPLQGGYARSVRRQAVAQARAAVDLLGHHPSIVMWCGHDVPERTMLRQQLPTWNKSILDRWVKRSFERSDETRPVVAYSGVAPHLPRLDGTDTHLHLGWGQGDERDLPGLAASVPRLVRFVGSFGSASVPPDAEFAEPDRWPQLDWDRLERDHGYDREATERHVPPSASATFEEWRLATQSYQATLLRFHIETLRRLKYRPTGGFCFDSLADASPAISTGIFDDQRRPKLACASVLEACRPLLVVADRPPAQVTVGDALALDIHVVNDLRVDLDGATCTATLRWAGGEHRWAWKGDIAADSVARVGIVQFVVADAPGELWLDLELEHGDHAATNRYESIIARP